MAAPAELGRLAVRVVADSVPLALLPWPAEAREVRGVLAAEAELGGTLARPDVAVRLEVRGAGARVGRFGLAVDSLGGPVRYHRGELVTPELEGRVGGGALRVWDPSGKSTEERRVGKECRSRWSPYH